MSFAVSIDPTNPGQFFACCGLLELADRLWPEPGAEGWFAAGGRTFQVECDGSLADVLSAARAIDFAQDGADGGEDDEDDEAAFSPLEITIPIRMWLDWWQDKELKPWAGSMNARAIALAMSRAVDPSAADPFGQTQVVSEVRPSASTGRRKGKAKPKEPFHFDARRGANAIGRDVGFIPDALKKAWRVPTHAHPVVELLALVGLQRCRPTPDGRKRRFRYHTWTYRCGVAALPVAVNGQLGDPQARGYRFVNFFRTGQDKHKAYAPAVLVTPGEDE